MPLKIKARIPFDANLLASLRGRGFTAHRSKNDIFTILPFNKSGAINIPTGLPKDYRLVLEAAEETNSEAVTVVCGNNGEPFHAYSFPEGPAIQALFTVARYCITVEMYSDKSVRISKYVLHTDTGLTPHFSHSGIWEGQNGQLPDDFIYFAAAIQAAEQKLTTKDTRTAFYALDDRRR